MVEKRSGIGQVEVKLIRYWSAKQLISQTHKILTRSFPDQLELC